MKVTIIAIGKCKKNSPEAAIIAEYVKRSGWDIVIKEKDNAAQEDEAEFLQSSIPHGAKVIVLDERGENLKSVELARKIETWMLNGCSELCFLIGGADGHLQSTRNPCRPHTFFRPADASPYVDAGSLKRTNLPHSDHYQPPSLPSRIKFCLIST